MTFLELAQTIDKAKEDAKAAEAELLAAELKVEDLKVEFTKQLVQLQEVVDGKSQLYRAATAKIVALFHQLQNVMSESGFDHKPVVRGQTQMEGADLKALFIEGQRIARNSR